MSATRLRIAQPEEVRLMLDWAAAEGWNPGKDDAAAFHAADPEGFFVAEVAGAPVAAISVVNHSDAFAFLGLYICDPAFRGRGIGFALWQHALAHAGGRTVGLDGVAAQQDNYARSGFARAGATMQFEGVVAPLGAPDIRALHPDDLPRLHRLDMLANGVTRPRFLSAWLAETATRRTMVLTDGAEPCGFATIRACRAGTKVGPIVAPDAAAGLALVQAAAAALPSDAQIIGVPSGNATFIALLEDQGFTETFTTARMYRGAAPATGSALMAVASMELG